VNLIEMITQWMLAMIASSGYLGVCLAMFVEGIFTPIPSELIMPFAGYLTSTGELSFPLVIIAGSLGATAGSIIAYLLGRQLGRPFLDRYGRYLGLGKDSLGKADAWFTRWGSYGILIGHAVPGVRSIISFPAGITRMDIKRFALFTFLGASVWNTILVTAGYFLGEYWVSFSQKLDGWDLAIIVVAVAAFIGYLVINRWRKRTVLPTDERR